MKKTIIFLLLIISMSIYRPMIEHFLPDLDTDYSTLLRKALQAGTVITYITICRLWGKVGKLKLSGRGLLILLPLFLLSFTTYLYGTRDKNLLGILMAVLITLLIGVIEELEFRGVIFSYLEEHGVYAILISSVLFGLVHLLNLIYEPDLLGVVIQVLFATGFGMVMAVIRYKTDLLLPQILMHTVWDFNQRMTLNDKADAVVDLIYYLSLLLVILWGLFLTYRIRKDEKRKRTGLNIIM